MTYLPQIQIDARARRFKGADVNRDGERRHCLLGDQAGIGHRLAGGLLFRLAYSLRSWAWPAASAARSTACEIWPGQASLIVNMSNESIARPERPCSRYGLS
jgi:hypothetical protein